eukprot:TRINITY_DN59939_c0_g1_i1.p1 TRINITY_DN59939_c0_g1~~TRINITY_DN59939_c0_g1_i1.p1  ORF type:complete len:542 (-),score=314.40 TRINITY_DN59939_c0_g1_i1:35-1660(-)
MLRFVSRSVSSKSSSLRAALRFRPSARLLSSQSCFSEHSFLKDLGLSEHNQGVFDGQKWSGEGAVLESFNPSTKQSIATTATATEDEYERVIAAMDAAKRDWAKMPAPLRGQVVRAIGEELREKREALGALVSLEMGKILPEGIGEVQEAVDICDFAVGLSRTINGQVLPSERPEHFMMERYNPLKGHVGIITAFNFPVAVYFWNLALSLVCGNTNVWKAADSVSLCAVACTRLVADVLEREGVNPAVATLALGPGATIGEKMVNDPRVELVSFTGSVKVGRHVNERVASRFGKSILELGGNNAMIVLEDADLELAKRAILFSAVGTAGQRCTSLRRVLVQDSKFDSLVASLVSAYESIKIGGSLEPGTLCGPLHNQVAMDNYVNGLEKIKAQGGKVLYGGNVRSDLAGWFVEPTIVEIDPRAECVQEELFGPVLYVMRVRDLDEAIELNNDVPQGLSSSLFTTNQQAIFHWTGELGSDCGIVNVNIGPSGAEIGGAFGGEKETGGGRESGSDSWKQYMRRSTCTVNYSKDLPLAQGIKFE